MENTTLTIFIKFLQACITPVAMISGVGLLLLTITNRMARVVDRIRQLVRECSKDQPTMEEHEIKSTEILIFYERAKLLRNSVAWIMIGMISSCLIIPVLFIMSFTTMNLNPIGYALFIIAVASMLTAFVYFFRDVLLSLMAIRIDAHQFIKEK